MIIQLQVQAAGRIISLRTTDGKMPVAQLQTAWNGPLPENTLVEVSGIVDNPTKIQCTDVYVFPPELSAGFDDDLHEQYFRMAQEFPELIECDVLENLGEGGADNPEVYDLEDYLKQDEVPVAGGESNDNAREDMDQSAFFNQL